MLKKIIIAEDPLSPESWRTVETENLCDFLLEHFGTFPEHARIYHGEVSVETDVTPSNESEIETLQALEGVFYVVLYPADPVSIGYAIGVIAVAIVAAIALNRDIPDPPEPMVRKQDNSSPNNELSDRKNRARINGRIPDIFGTVRSTPDLIAPSYTVYENSLKVEHSLMCIGKGSFEIPASEVKEGTTPADQITDSSIEVYGSGVNPNPTATPQVAIGERITESFLSTERNAAVNGQTLNPEGDLIIVGSGDIGFFADYRDNDTHQYYVGNDGSYNFRNFISTGSKLKITDPGYTLRKLDLTKPMNGAAGGPTISVVFTGDTPGFYLLDAPNIPGNGLVTLKISNLNVTRDGKEYNLDGVYSGTRNPAVPPLAPPSVTLHDAPLVNTAWAELIATGDRIEQEEIGQNWTMYFETEDVPADASGEYVVGAVDEDRAYLYLPEGENPVWSEILLQQEGDYALPIYHSPTLENLTGSIVGPFIVDDPETTEILINFSALQGLYKDDGTDQTEINVEIETDITPIDAVGNATGATRTFSTNINGSSVSKGVRSATGQFRLFNASRYSVSCRRITPFVSGFTGQVSEEIKWVDLYGAKGIDSLDFGDVTTVRSKARATAGATSAESRELNMLVTRKIPQRVSGSDFTTELYPSNNAADIISFVCLDPRIGNRSKDEIDFDNIYDTVAEIEEYFGSSIAGEFNYTFDSDNISFEEIMVSVCDVIFCTPYRRGSSIKINFEQETENSTLLFNHRNKLPGSETRTVRFGNRNSNDGIEFDYVDPLDDSVQTFYLPNQNLINPQRIDMPGVRNKLQAHFHAHRLWNKIQHQHIATEFEATQEADLLVLGDRILNADNTRPNIQDGEVVGQFGLELELSQKVDLSGEPAYTIFLQSPDGFLESFGVVAGSTAYKVILDSPPSFTLSLDFNNYARTTYIIVAATDVDANAFIVTEKQPNSNFTSTVVAINYDSRYYDNDKDLENGIVDVDGNTN